MGEGERGRERGGREGRGERWRGEMDGEGEREEGNIYLERKVIKMDLG